MKLNSYATSGTSPTKFEPDFTAQNHFTLFLLFPHTDAAQFWISENLQPDYLTFGQGIVIEARYFWTILEAIQNSGLEVSRD